MVSGWGRTSGNAGISDVLLDIEVNRHYLKYTEIITKWFKIHFVCTSLLKGKIVSKAKSRA